LAAVIPFLTSYPEMRKIIYSTRPEQRRTELRATPGGGELAWFCDHGPLQDSAGAWTCTRCGAVP
jgi:hypothetical protein